MFLAGACEGQLAARVQCVAMRISSIVLLAIVLLSIRPAVAADMPFSTTPVTGKLVYFKVVDEARVPRLAGTPPATDGPRPFAPGGLQVPIAFEGQHEGYHAFVERPDMGLAVSPRFVVQSINPQVAVYSSDGRLMPGWPKAANRFLGLQPNAFVVDTRAQWDTWDHRFWVTFLCPHGYCVAVSKGPDPNGVWYVYGFDLRDAPGYEIDFGMFAFDAHTISVSTHLAHYYHGLKGLHGNIFTIAKAPLESGSQDVAPQGYADLHVAGHDLDTVEPVLVPDSAGTQPPGEFFMSTKGFNFTCNFRRPFCSTVYLFMLSPSPSGQTISATSFETEPYDYTYGADTPRCRFCLETVGPMMTTSPVYDHGLISYAFGTGAYNGSQHIAGIRWGQVRPSVSGSTLTGVHVVQGGTFVLPGDTAAFFPSVMTDYAGDLFMEFDESSSSLNPSVAVAARRATDPLDQFTQTTIVRRGIYPPTTIYYGDYTGATFSGAGGPVWFASEYAGVKGVFGTEIFNVKF